MKKLLASALLLSVHDSMANKQISQNAILLVLAVCHVVHKAPPPQKKKHEQIPTVLFEASGFRN